MIVSTKKFLVHASSKQFIADISDLGPGVLRKIYPDSCDLGLTLLSAKTNEVSSWVVNHEDRDQEYELLRYTLAPASESIRKFPKLTGWTMTIFND